MIQQHHPYTTQREFLFYCFMGSIFLLLITTCAVTGYVVYPSEDYIIAVGDVADYPPSWEPYFSRIGEKRIWLANRGQ